MLNQLYIIHNICSHRALVPVQTKVQHNLPSVPVYAKNLLSILPTSYFFHDALADINNIH